MGYRSDVAYVIKFETIAQRDAFITLMLAKNDKELREAIDEVSHDDSTDPIITFSCQDVKWYNSYPDVMGHHVLMEEAVSLYGAGYRFVRVGEDANDIEVRDRDDVGYDLWDYVDPVTHIRTNF